MIATARGSVPGISAALVAIALLLGLSVLSSILLELRLAHRLALRAELVETLSRARRNAMQTLIAAPEATITDDPRERQRFADIARTRTLEVRADLDRLASESREDAPEVVAAVEDARAAWIAIQPSIERMISLDQVADERPDDPIARALARDARLGLLRRSDRWNDAISRVFLSHAQSGSSASQRYELVALVDLAGSLSLLVIAGVIVVRGVARPLRELERGLARVAAGDRAVRLEPRGVEETRAVARGFNAMADALSSRDRRIDAQSAELNARNRALAAANVELDHFAYAASHDLRAPLRGIDSMARFLQEDWSGKLDDRSRGYLERIRRAAQRLDRLINDLLDVARAGRALGPTEDVSLGDVVREALAEIEEAVRATRAEVEVPAVLPVVRGDRTRLVLVFQNLLSNAVKYSSGEGRVPRIRVRGRVEGTCAVVSVEDNGIGIPPEQAERIFGLFRRLHREGEYEGTGVGLSIVKRIVGAHGGRVTVESAPGRGSRFVVTLPLRGEPERQAA